MQLEPLGTHVVESQRDEMAIPLAEAFMLVQGSNDFEHQGDLVHRLLALWLAWQSLILAGIVMPFRYIL
jgi:hypothetical protein